MADRPLNPALQRAPLQESRVHSNINHLRQQLHGINTLNPHHGLVNKPGQEVSFTRSSSANLPVKPTMAPHMDKDTTRQRIALQQKPLTSNNAQNTKAPPGSARIQSNPMHKPKPVPFPGFTSTTPSYTRSDANIENQCRSQSQHTDYAQHLPQPQDTEPRSQAKHKNRVSAEYGSPEWTQQMANVLPRCRFYFDSVDPSMIKKISDVVRRHKGATTSFFSNEVTHIITTRPVPDESVLERIRNQDNAEQSATAQLDHRKNNTKPLTQQAPNAEMGILVKALSLGIKIWTLDLTLKLLAPLAPGLAKQTDDRKLKDMLQYEKVHGVATVHIDNSTKPDFYAFQGKYVLVDDTTGYYRTIMAYDFTAKPSPTGKQPWPRLYIQDSDRSPFCLIEPVTKASERPTGERDDKGQEIKQDKDLSNAVQDARPADDQKLSPSAMASGLVNSITSNIISTTTSTASKPAAANPQQDRRVEQLEKRALNATKVEAAISADFVKKHEFARPLDVVRPDTGSKTVGNATQDIGPGRESIADAGSKMQPPTLPVKHIHPGLAISANNERAVAQGNDTLDPVRREANNAQPAHPVLEAPISHTAKHKEAKDYRKQRYCENCRGFFENFEKHIETPAHRKYAHDASKFAQLDILLTKLQRKPRISSGLSELPTTSPAPAEPEPSDGTFSMNATFDKPVMPDLDPVCEVNIQEGMDITPHIQEVLIAVNIPTLHPEQDVSREHDVSRELDEMVQEMQKTTDRPHGRQDVGEDEGIVEDMDEEGAPRETEDQATLIFEPTRNAVEVGDIADELSSEMSQLGLSERGVNRFSDQPNDTGSVAPFEAQEEKEAEEGEQEEEETTVVETVPPSDLLEDKLVAPSSLQKVLRHEFRLPGSDRSGLSDSNATSQLETDTTQPDDRFLDRSASATASVDDGLSTPVRLRFDTSSTVASPNAPRTINQAPFSPEALNESDREGSDDGVSLVKSPSAGRGQFGRNQGVGLRDGLFTPNRFARDASMFSPCKDITSGLYKGALKRKLDNVLAEERAASQSQSCAGTAAETPDASRYTGLLVSRKSLSTIGAHSQQPSNSSRTASTPLRSESWVIHSPSRSSTRTSSPMSPHEPLELLFQTSPLLASQPQQAAVDRSHQRQAQLASGYFHPSLSSQLEYESPSPTHREPRRHGQSTGPQQTPPPLPSQQRLQQGGIPIVPFQDYLMRDESETRAKSGHPGPVVSSRRELEAPPASQSSPIAFSSPEGLRSPVNFMGQGYGFSSPSQSPSRRAQRKFFPVMTHAEQEEERVYQHYHGNQLPEPAGGQKKMRSSSSLAEAYEEYGEGAMVFIE
ncbi:hypothetical protein K457DRAFT_19072 [Linnemannia elongata AG-77]|uniref:DBF4-type domain-containing protein n=1 Tax=Linnemannia elongata AG-77 TaxID=1314771 RepID=A0A197JWG5_9FUNG|nr:hypothetical protein K457DRAFT_19072 [Linnemannia elongata AG-77]